MLGQTAFAVLTVQPAFNASLATSYPLDRALLALPIALFATMLQATVPLVLVAFMLSQVCALHVLQIACNAILPITAMIAG